MQSFRSLLSHSTAITRAYLVHRAVGPTAATASPLPPYRALLRRTLILQTAADPIKINKLSDSDEGNYYFIFQFFFPNIETNNTSKWAGIVELKLDRVDAKNAINKEMLRGIKNALESMDGDSSAKVLLVSSASPRVFCAGADLKVLHYQTIFYYAYWSFYWSWLIVFYANN